jgi:glycosyltransferase involved in cell wall biosynthesis
MISHTFILREVLLVRRQGIEIMTCSIREPPAESLIGPDEAAAHGETFYVISAARDLLQLAAAHLSIFFRSPSRWFSAFALAWRTRPEGMRAALWQFFYFLEAAVLAQHLRRNNVEHLHNHFANSSCSVAMLTSAMSGIPFSFTLHGPSVFFEAYRWRIDEKVARARFVACISHFARSQAMLLSDRQHWDKLKIVHCGVDPAQYGPDPDRAYAKRILFIGRLAAIKGVPLLLDGITALLPMHPDLRLTIVGDGPDRATLEAQAAAQDLSAVVQFVGYKSQDEVARLLEAHDILVLPSFAEGVPVVLMEAMASRVPVVASRVAGVPELVEDEVSGYLTPPGDLGSLVDRLGRLLADAELCRRMGAAGRAKVEAEFDLGSEAAWMARLLSGQGTGPALRPVPTKPPGVDARSRPH